MPDRCGHVCGVIGSPSSFARLKTGFEDFASSILAAKEGILNHILPFRSCKLPEILTFGCTALILTHDKLFSMSQVTPILTNMYITHNNIHMAP